jgi:hypothetical protein
MQVIQLLALQMKQQPETEVLFKVKLENALLAFAIPNGKSLVEIDAPMQTYDPSIHPPYDPLEFSNDEPYKYQSDYDKQQPKTAIVTARNSAVRVTGQGGRDRGAPEQQKSDLNRGQ